jgi:ABC-type transport system involved in multi-copper enzyme maturation permease subunit
MSTSLEPLVAEPLRRPGARLAGYARWQLRDYLVDRGIPTALVGSLFGYMVGGAMIGAMRAPLERMSPAELARAGGLDAVRAVMMGQITALFLTQLLGNLVFLGALFAMNGIVANDRKQGYYRFLFSKPLSPVRYYGQAFFVHWAGFLLVVTLLGLLYQGLVGPILTTRLYAAVALLYLCYAGIAFALSAAARWDWLSLVAVTVAANYLWLRFGQSRGALTGLLYLFPPLHRTSEVFMALANGVALPWHLLGWLAVYGAVCFVIGLVVLRFRRLAII